MRSKAQQKIYFWIIRLLFIPAVFFVLIWMRMLDVISLQKNGPNNIKIPFHLFGARSLLGILLLMTRLEKEIILILGTTGTAL